MKHLSLGLMLALTACGDPSQFNELMTGEPIYVDEKPAENATPVTYAGELPSDETEAGSETQAEASPAEENTQASQDVAVTNTPPQLFTDCDETPDKGIVADLYQLPENTNRLPDFGTLDSIRSVCLSQLNIKDRPFAEGFPGVEDLFEWFALDMRFQVNVPKKGTYEFTLLSDDGAIVRIDGNKVIDNDGLHAVTEKKAKVYLEAGQHDFHVSYYQGPRWRIALELYWKVPGTSSKVHIPASAISRP